MIINKAFFKIITKVFLWEIGVIVFLGLFVVISILNLYFVYRVKNEIARGPGVGELGFQKINSGELEKAVEKITERRQNFESMLVSPTSIKDPSI